MKHISIFIFLCIASNFSSAQSNFYKTSTPIDQLHTQPIYQPPVATPVHPQNQQMPAQSVPQYKPSNPRPSSIPVQPSSKALSSIRAMPYQECLTVVNMIAQNIRQTPAVVERTPTLQKFKFADGAKNNYITCDQSTNSMKMDTQ